MQFTAYSFRFEQQPNFLHDLCTITLLSQRLSTTERHYTTNTVCDFPEKEQQYQGYYTYWAKSVWKEDGWCGFLKHNNVI